MSFSKFCFPLRTYGENNFEEVVHGLHTAASVRNVHGLGVSHDVAIQIACLTGCMLKGQENVLADVVFPPSGSLAGKWWPYLIMGLVARSISF